MIFFSSSLRFYFGCSLLLLLQACAPPSSDSSTSHRATEGPLSEMAAAYCTQNPHHKRVDFEGGDYYIGQSTNGFFQGKGHYHSEEEGWAYSGGWFQNNFHGRGEYRCPAGDVYVGFHNRGLREGYGTYFHAVAFTLSPAEAGAHYYGEWAGDTYHGWGLLQQPDGNIQAGIWAEGQLDTAKTTETTLDYLNNRYNVDLEQQLNEHPSAS